MNTSYRVTSAAGELLGIFGEEALATFAIRDLVKANPGADVEVVVSYDACTKHPAYEPDNCPDCGTGRSI